MIFSQISDEIKIEMLDKTSRSETFAKKVSVSG